MITRLKRSQHFTGAEHRRNRIKAAGKRLTDDGKFGTKVITQEEKAMVSQCDQSKKQQRKGIVVMCRCQASASDMRQRFTEKHNGATISPCDGQPLHCIVPLENALSVAAVLSHAGL